MTERHDPTNWARPVPTFHVGEVPADAFKGNVEGRRPVGPLQGFGQLWQKNYEVGIPAVKPEEVIATWKDRFGEFWPTDNRFYPPAGGLEPGEVAIIGGQSGPIKMSTGVRVIYADERSWAYMMPEGHPFSALITFSAHEAEGMTVAGVHALLRASDPIFEIAFKLYTSRLEDRIWVHTLTALSGHFGVDDAQIEQRAVLVDRRRQWRQFGNITKNSVLRSLIRRDR